MPEKISLTGGNPSPATAPDPAPGPTTGLTGSAPIVGSGTVSEAEAIAASGHTKITTITGLAGASAPIGQSGQSVSVGGLVDGKLAVELMDATLPSLMVFLLYKIGMKLRKSDLQLTEKEKNTLSPIMQKCLESLMINFNNPWVALSVSILTIYGAKIIEKGGVAFLDGKLKKQESEALKIKEDINKPVSPDPPPVKLPPYEPTEVEIKRKMKDHKYSRVKAIEVLKKLQEEGKPLFVKKAA